MLLNSHILAYARCLAGKVCGLVRSTWGTSQGEDKLGARDKILNTKGARRACTGRAPGMRWARAGQTFSRGLHPAGADHRWGHPAPCGDGPPKILKLGGHVDTLHAHRQPVAAHGLPKGGGDVPCILPQDLTRILGEYDQRVRDWCYHSYAQAGESKSILFSWVVSASTQQHLETQAARWMAISDQWVTNAWFQKERHLAAEADVVRRLLLKRKRYPSLWGVSVLGTRRASFFDPSPLVPVFAPTSPNNLEYLLAVSKNLAHPLHPIHDDGKSGGWKWWE